MRPRGRAQDAVRRRRQRRLLGHGSRETSKKRETLGEFTREIKPIVEFGYLTLTVDTTAKPPALTIAFRSTDGKQTHDEVTVAL